MRHNILQTLNYSEKGVVEKENQCPASRCIGVGFLIDAKKY
jgi:hypothetical protein